LDLHLDSVIVRYHERLRPTISDDWINSGIDTSCVSWIAKMISRTLVNVMDCLFCPFARNEY
jgi:hypothetical protein